MAIRRKFVLAGLGAAVPLILAGVGSVVVVRNAVGDQVIGSLNGAADLLAARVDDQIEFGNANLIDAAGGSGLGPALLALPNRPSQADGPALTLMLDKELQRFSSFHALALYSPDGQFLADTGSSGAPTQPAEAVMLARTRFERSALGQAFRKNNDGYYQHGVAVTDDAGEVQALLVAECLTDKFADLLASPPGVGRNADVHLVQRGSGGGAQFITPLRYRTGAELAAEIPASKVEAPAIRALSGEAHLIEGGRDYRDERVVAAVRPIAGGHWGLVVKEDHSEVVAPIRQVAIVVSVVFVAALLLLITATLLLYRSVARRLARVTRAAERISTRQLTGRVDDRSSDEIGRLARAFDDMTDRLRVDIRSRERAEEELERLAHHDVLTGLPNRLAANRRLREARERARTGRGSVGVLFCDLDKFKQVNDELGHAMGDELLRGVGRRLQRAAGPHDFVARFGGDEFLIIAEHLADAHALERLADGARQSLAEPIDVGGHPIVVTVSIGSVLSCAAQAHEAPENLLRYADAAMYLAKEQGRNRHVRSGPLLRDQVETEAAVVGRLRQAIERNELELRFRPVVALADHRLLGLQASAAWPDQRDGTAMRATASAELECLAARYALGIGLDRWLFDRAAAELAGWRALGIAADLRLWLSVSSATLRAGNLADVVRSATARGRLDPAALVALVGEEAFAVDAVTADAQIAELQALGVRIVLDRFDRGAHTFDCIRRVPFDGLRLSGDFVEAVDSDRGSRAVVASLTTLANSLGMDVLAEGVDRPDQVLPLLHLGCCGAQGDAVGPWLYPCDVEDYLARACRKESVAGARPARRAGGFSGS